MRSQANTAKLLEVNPTLLRFRELEVLERVAGSGNLNDVLGKQGLAERIVNLIQQTLARKSNCGSVSGPLFFGWMAGTKTGGL